MTLRLILKSVYQGFYGLVIFSSVSFKNLCIPCSTWHVCTHPTSSSFSIPFLSSPPAAGPCPHFSGPLRLAQADTHACLRLESSKSSGPMQDGGDGPREIQQGKHWKRGRWARKHRELSVILYMLIGVMLRHAVSILNTAVKQWLQGDAEV